MRIVRRLGWCTSFLLASIAGGALACAPTPKEAAERFVRASEQCDFVAAWELLAATERAAVGSVADWTGAQAEEASRTLGCRARVENFAVGTVDGDSVAVTYVLAEPVVVSEFRHLLREREFADVSEWRRLDRAIFDARARLLAADNWEPRSRIVADVATVREGADWCIDAGEARRAAFRRAQRERSEAARLAREAGDRAARERGEAALPLVSVDAVRVGESVLREAGVWGEVVNRSPETLRAVEIRVEYLDRDGLVIGQKTYSPILFLPSLGSSARDHPPLPPGHRRPFGVRADDAPSTWARRVRVVVVRVEADPTIEPRGPPAPALPAGSRRR